MTAKLKALLHALAARTDSGRVEWHELDGESYRTHIGDRLVRVSRGTRRVETEPDYWTTLTAYFLTVTNDDGKVIEDEEFVEGEGETWIAEGLFKAARRSALDSEAALDEMLHILQANPN